MSIIRALTYVIPWDRATIDSPLGVVEATGRLQATTVKRHWVRVLAAVPGTFEGAISGTREHARFCVLTSAEGYKVLGFARIRNLGRPVCDGRIAAATGGCRVRVTFRPQGFMLAVMAYLFVFGFVMAPLVPAATWTQNHIDTKWVAAFPAIFVLNYIIGTAAFWTMRNRAIRALREVLGSESKKPLHPAPEEGARSPSPVKPGR